MDARRGVAGHLQMTTFARAAHRYRCLHRSPETQSIHARVYVHKVQTRKAIRSRAPTFIANRMSTCGRVEMHIFASGVEHIVGMIASSQCVLDMHGRNSLQRPGFDEGL
ncbi:hypothetical protein HYPSUDRAFT_651392 [Hypholoma sublateritium FD-334 SS-4]|uniref:Uncharacterized protein n=1 Tax=Hypholoma sublateritium (strain FD-334 SS-4) TaxID=945553 RepID=A0A0D2MFX1_HYPSF|nr:hypothetical protein HYPSUDRAFT_651392 [Hypholoma sublateritium FD-334 SS-4]